MPLIFTGNWQPPALAFCKNARGPCSFAPAPFKCFCLELRRARRSSSMKILERSWGPILANSLPFSII